MPELPEVETVRRGLEQVVLQKRIVSVEVPGTRSVRRQSKGAFKKALLGQRLERARRRGKYLLLELSSGAVLVVHLRMSGQLSFVPGPSEARLAHTHVVLGFSDQSELRFIDPRTFGELFVTSALDDQQVPVVLASLGLDPLVDGCSHEQLALLVKGRRTSLKAFLLDQANLCGIGNIYADEIAFCAKLRPDRRTESLSPKEIAALQKSIETVLAKAVELGGSSLKDARYRDLLGELGRFQIHHAVYGRRGAACPRCAAIVESARIVGRSAHFCPSCQR